MVIAEDCIRISVMMGIQVVVMGVIPNAKLSLITYAEAATMDLGIDALG